MCRGGVALARDGVDVGPLGQDQLDKLLVALVNCIVEAGAKASSLIENIQVRSFFNQYASTVPFGLGQGMMKRREGGVVGGSVDVSSSLKKWHNEVSMTSLTSSVESCVAVEVNLVNCFFGLLLQELFCLGHITFSAGSKELGLHDHASEELLRCRSRCFSGSSLRQRHYLLRHQVLRRSLA